MPSLLRETSIIISSEILRLKIADINLSVYEITWALWCTICLKVGILKRARSRVLIVIEEFWARTQEWRSLSVSRLIGSTTILWWSCTYLLPEIMVQERRALRYQQLHVRAVLQSEFLVDMWHRLAWNLRTSCLSGSMLLRFSLSSNSAISQSYDPMIDLVQNEHAKPHLSLATTNV